MADSGTRVATVGADVIRVVLLAMALTLVGCTPTSYTHGVPNLSQVDAARNVWRSGQPTTPEQWDYLRSLGIRTVVKLDYDDEGSDQGALDVGLQVVVLSMQPDEHSGIGGTFVRPDPALFVEAVRVMAQGNALVHCVHGQDRTSSAVGWFRVHVQGWSKNHAWGEAIDHGYHVELVGLDRIWASM